MAERRIDVINAYFAFTATPKSSTLKLFGTFGPERVHPKTGTGRLDLL